MDETQDDALVSGECWSNWYRVSYDHLPMDAHLPMGTPGAIRHRWRWLDLGGTGPVAVYAEAPDLPREDDYLPTECEPGTKLDPRPDVIGACVQMANLEE